MSETSTDKLGQGGRIYSLGSPDQLRSEISHQRNAVTLLLLSLSYGLSYFDRMLVVVLGEHIKLDFSLSDKQLSFISGASFVVVYGIAGLAAGWLIDRQSRKRLLVGALLLWSLFTVSCGLARSFAQLGLARAGVGIGEAANVPAAFSIIGDAYAPRHRPMATALFYTGGMIGVLGAFLIGGWIGQHHGWRVAFFAAGPPGVAIALMIALFLKEPARAKSAVSANEKSASTFKIIWQDEPLKLLLLAQALAGFANAGMMQWLPMFFMRSHHLDIASIGLLFGPAMAGGMIFGLLLGGWLGNKIAEQSVTRMIYVCAGTVCFVVIVYVVLLLANSSAFALILTFFAMALATAYTPVSAGAWQTICDASARGTASGLSGFLAALFGSAICPFVVGAISDALAPSFGLESLRYALIAGMLFCVIGVLLFMQTARLLDRNRKGYQDQPSS